MNLMKANIQISWYEYRWQEFTVAYCCHKFTTKPFLSHTTAAMTLHNTTPFKLPSLQMPRDALLLTAAWIWVQNGGHKFHSQWQFVTGNRTPHECKWSAVTHCLASLCISISTKVTNIHKTLRAIWVHHSEPKFWQKCMEFNHKTDSKKKNLRVCEQKTSWLH